MLFEKRAAWIILGLGIGLLALAIISIGSGTLYISPVRTLAVLLGSGDPSDTTVIMKFRLPRLLLAAMAGMALALAGAILQGVIRNPLASPEIIGINSGASMVVVMFLALFSDVVSLYWLPAFAFAGAISTVCIIYFAAWKNGTSPLRMVLIGFGVTALLEAAKTLFLIFGPIWRTSQAQIWMTGSVYGANWSEVGALAPWLVCLIPLLFVLLRWLNIQVLGDELPVVLGARVQLQRLFLIGTAAALSGSAVAFVGGIGFIGLMAPHISRKLVGGSQGPLLICSALIGALLLVAADLCGRMLLPPRDIPAGVFTAVLGAPFLLILLIQINRRRS
ncbi:FecCD family ABC transporter permease [Shouchella rhizosphaerae]|uniref:FecCD family ABC transporter permease n=1 Tax=Shouchella rhizosphaerae TaxID=866786 RepID=UPI003F7F9907